MKIWLDLETFCELDIRKVGAYRYVEHESFEEWWRPFTFGVGPAGAYAQSLGESELVELRERCRELLAEESFTLTAVAWAARGSSGPLRA